MNCEENCKWNDDGICVNRFEECPKGKNIELM